MRIVVDVDNFTKKIADSESDLNLRAILELLGKCGEHTFLLLVPRQPVGVAGLPSNVDLLVANTPAISWWRAWFWYRFFLPPVLKRAAADLYLAIDKPVFRRQAIPTCLLWIEGGRLAGGKQANRPARLVQKKARNASLTITMSNHEKELIRKVPAAPPTTVFPIIHPAKTLAEEEKERTKSHYSRGTDYFLVAGDFQGDETLLNLLKAFSRFKKWQQSGLQLVITARNGNWTAEFEKKLGLFRYKNDVHFLIDPDATSLTNLIGSALALLYPALPQHFPQILFIAMQCGVPVITSSLPLIRELAGDTVHYSTDDAESFFTAMLSVYKDESLRARLVAGANERITALRQANDDESWCRLLTQVASSNHSNFA